MEKQDRRLTGLTGLPLASRQSSPSFQAQVTAALFYGMSSLAIMFVNKMVLTSYSFPSFNFLAASQFAFTSVILYTLKKAGKVSITDASWDVMRIMLPLIGVSLGNVLSGLSGTKKINLPMFTVLRRFSILFTMLLERHLLGVRASERVQLSVFLMIFGSFIAAISDLAFDMEGYAMIFLNNTFTALSGVIMKKTVMNSSINRMGVLFHSSWVSILIMLGVLGLRPQEMEKVRSFPHWDKPDFVFAFVLASLMGSILNYSTFLCTALNSALTTTVVGCLKNVLTTYLGMIFLPDYIFSWSNFLGLNISIGGSLLYSWNEFVNKQNKNDPKGKLWGARGTTPRSSMAARGGGDVGTREDIQEQQESLLHQEQLQHHRNVSQSQLDKLVGTTGSRTRHPSDGSRSEQNLSHHQHHHGSVSPLLAASLSPTNGSK